MQEKYEALKNAVLDFIETYDAYWSLRSQNDEASCAESWDEMMAAYDDMAALVEAEPEIP